MSAISVLVADGQRLFGEALAAALDDDESLAVCQPPARSPDDVLDAVAAHHPDVVLIDSELDYAADGSLMNELRARAPSANVIVLAWLHRMDDVEQLLVAGAVGYLPKSCDVEVVAQAVRQVHAGEASVLADLDDLRTELEQRRAATEQLTRRFAALTPREREVLDGLAAGRTIHAIAEHLGASAPTVRTHIRNLKRKTGARTQLEAVRMVHGTAKLSNSSLTASSLPYGKAGDT